MKPVNEDRFTEFAADYALGLLEGEELEDFERHLAAGCAACEQELAAMDAVGDALAYSIEPVPPPAPLRDRVLAAVDADLAAESAAAALPSLATAPGRPASMSAREPAIAPAGQPLYRGQPTVAPTYEPAPAAWPPRGPVVVSERKPSFWQRLAPAVAFAGILATALSGFMAYRSNLQIRHMRSDLERLQAENQALARVMDVVQSDRLRLIALGGTEHAPQSSGRVLWSPDAKKAVLYASGLPRPPAGRDYQLWVIEGQTPRSEGVFPVDAQGRATHVLPEVPAPGGVGAFAVTLEPAGGVPQPTGDMVLLGAVPAQVN
jgi:anti-sigma-K factor RskA